MAENLDKIDKSSKVQSSWLDFYKKEISLSVDNQVQASRNDSYVMAFILATRGLGGRLDNVELSMIGLTRNSTPQAAHTVQVPDPHLGLEQTTGPAARQTQGQPINVDGGGSDGRTESKGGAKD
jgi:hypothetical protein